MNKTKVMLMFISIVYSSLTGCAIGYSYDYTNKPSSHVNQRSNPDNLSILFSTEFDRFSVTRWASAPSEQYITPTTNSIDNVLVNFKNINRAKSSELYNLPNYDIRINLLHSFDLGRYHGNAFERSGLLYTFIHIFSLGVIPLHDKIPYKATYIAYDKDNNKLLEKEYPINLDTYASLMILPGSWLVGSTQGNAAEGFLNDTLSDFVSSL